MSMKVVWLCQFINEEMKARFNTPDAKEYCPWINTLKDLFKDVKEIELHIVAPNLYTNKRKELQIDNVYYHFYNYKPKFIPKRIYNFIGVDIWTDFFVIKSIINKIICKINPDIIHLHGAELPIHSAGILPLINKYPTLVTIQGFVRNSTQKSLIIRKRISIEEKILKNTNHIGTRTKEMSDTALQLNPAVKLHFHNYPMTLPKKVKNNSIPEEFDIIFFARINKDKGIEDLVEALALVKKVIPSISLHIIGNANQSYINLLNNKIEELGLRENIKYLGFMATQNEIFEYALNAKICVLPTYHDVIPGTILESMYMKLPVIAYAVGGIPELNTDGEALILVDKNNIRKLADKIIELLRDENKRISMAEFAFDFVKRRFNNDNVIIDILKSYNKILSK